MCYQFNKLLFGQTVALEAAASGTPTMEKVKIGEPDIDRINLV